MKKVILLIAILIALLIVANSAQAQWEPDVRLTNSSDSSNTSWSSTAWCISTSGDLVHVVWYDKRDGNQEIYYKRSTDGGMNWGEDTRLTNDIGLSAQPSVLTSGSVVNVIWYDNRNGNNEIYYKSSIDGGISWGEDTRLTNDNASSVNPSLSVSGSNLHLVWKDNRNGSYEQYYKRSTDGGISWGNDTRLTNNSSFKTSTSVSASSSNVYLFWSDRRDGGNGEIYYKISIDGGKSWSEDKRLTNTPGGMASGCCIAVAGSVVNVVWNDSRDGNAEIYYKNSTNGGISWGEDKRLTNAPSSSVNPSLSLSGSNLHIVWADRRNGNYDIFYKCSTNGGIDWSADTLISNNNVTGSALPSVALSATAVHVVWQDLRDGPSGEIYYKRNPTGNAVSVDEKETLVGDLAISPNPASDFITINLDRCPTSSRCWTSAEIQIYNALSEKVMSVVQTPSSEQNSEQTGAFVLPSVRVNISDLPKGMYFVKYGTETKKFVVIR